MTNISKKYSKSNRVVRVEGLECCAREFKIYQDPSAISSSCLLIQRPVRAMQYPHVEPSQETQEARKYNQPSGKSGLSILLTKPQDFRPSTFGLGNLFRGVRLNRIHRCCSLN